MMPASLALIGAAFSGEARGRAVGTWAAAGAITGALGPLAGGWLIDTVGWRPIFLINLPIALVAAGLAWRYVEESRSDDPAPLDWGGAFLATAGLAALTLGLTVLAGQHGVADGTVAAAATRASSTTLAVAGLGTGAALLVAFVFLEARLGARAMMPLGLFGTRSFVGVTLLTRRSSPAFTPRRLPPARWRCSPGSRLSCWSGTEAASSARLPIRRRSGKPAPADGNP